ncbi:MAG: 50S ribosomal protein L11 methyltransferase [Rickettsiales bacterium]
MNHPAEFTLLAGASAFGDGQHPTTLGMLTALGAIDPHAFTPRVALDVGAGSGILSFVIARQFGCPVVATDISAQAIETLIKNAQANGFERHITALQADGFAHPAIAQGAPYDLITMNILAEPLLRLAHDTAAALAPGGVLLLSGMLSWQEPQIRDAYQSLGLELATRLAVGDWVTLAFSKPAL